MGSTLMRALHQVGTGRTEVYCCVLYAPSDICWDVLYPLRHQYWRVPPVDLRQLWISLDKYGFLGGVVCRYCHWCPIFQLVQWYRAHILYAEASLKLQHIIFMRVIDCPFQKLCAWLLYLTLTTRARRCSIRHSMATRRDTEYLLRPSK